VAQLVNVLRREIAAGVWGQRLPGELPLCEHFKVSRATLRAALGELEKEGWLTAQKGRRREIRLLPGSTDPFPLQKKVVLLSPVSVREVTPGALFWMDELRTELAMAGYQLSIHISQAVYKASPARALETLTGSLRAAGWVLYLSSQPMQQWFTRQRLACVITGSRHPDIPLPAFDVDYHAACRHAVGLFLARGHRRLALIIPRSSAAGDRQSEDAFLAAASGTPEVDAQICHHDGTAHGICVLLDRLLARPAAPNGFLVTKPTHVLTVMSHLARRGVHLPKAASLIARDDEPFLAHLVPTVARYTVDQKLFARRVSHKVLDLLHGGKLEGSDSLIIPKFVPGDTLG
jgi:LacI family transcriptional regulator